MLRHFISLLLVTMCVFGLLMNDVQAKRFGGGKSFGMSRSVSTPSRAQSMPGMNQNATKNRWLAPLAGLAMGGLLASLFMGNGFGTGILTWLMVAGIALVVITFLRNLRRNPAQSTAYNNFRASSANDFMSSSSSSDSPFAKRYPYNFDEHAFLRDVKAQFIRLQTAYDQGDLNDLREFTNPEVFAEIRLQLQERGNAVNKTDVVNLDANVLDVDNRGEVASVEFSGLISEENQPAEQFKEIWHFQKNDMTQRWKVAGIQQS